MAKTLYELLLVTESATTQQIHHAFKQIESVYAKQLDSRSVDALNRIREAFLVLSDTNRRIEYDRKLALGRLPLSPASAQLTSSPSTEQHPSNRWLQRIAITLLLLFPVASWFYHQREQSRLTAETQQLIDSKVQAATETLIAEQARWLQDSQPARSGMEETAESKRIASELRLKQQQLDDIKTLNQQELDNQAKNLDLLANRLETESQVQKSHLAQQQIEMQYQKPAMRLDLQEQQDQHNAQVRQRALQQHDQAIASIESLRAARLRAYDRDHGNGAISSSNPALDP